MLDEKEDVLFRFTEIRQNINYVYAIFWGQIKR